MSVPALIVDYLQSMVHVGSESKRLPIKIACDHVFSQIIWDGTAGAIYYLEGGTIPFSDERIVEPFHAMFQIEPPQGVAEQIGARAQFEQEDSEWLAVLARHRGETIEIQSRVEAASKAIADAAAAKNAAGQARHRAHQEMMNAKRRSLGRPERVYRDGDSFAVDGTGRG